MFIEDVTDETFEDSVHNATNVNRSKRGSYQKLVLLTTLTAQAYVLR